MSLEIFLDKTDLVFTKKKPVFHKLCDEYMESNIDQLIHI